MSFRLLKYETDDRVAVITLNRPEKMNALSVELCDEIEGAIKRADEDDDVRVVVVTGAGGRAFSAGYDLGEGEAPTVAFYAERLRHDLEFTYSAWNCTKPVIAMIDGFCLAGGLEFAQMCDIRYCSDDSEFAVIETRFANGVATLAMPWVIGPLSRELIYGGGMIDAATALRIGLVNRVFSKAELHDEVMKIAKRMSRVALRCLQWNKRALNHTYETMGFSAALQYGLEACVVMDTAGSPEGDEFFRRLSETGLEDALAWRSELFAAYE